jgi:hypothetical protein
LMTKSAACSKSWADSRKSTKTRATFFDICFRDRAEISWSIPMS